MNLSLGWFKSKKKEELSELQLEEQRLKVEILQKRLNKENPEPVQRVFKSVKLVNNVLTVVFNDGTVIVKAKSTPEDFENVRKALNEVEILNILGETEIAEEKAQMIELREISEGMVQLSQLDDFVIKEDESVYLKGINRSLPPLLMKKFAAIVNDRSKKGEGWKEALADDDEFQGVKRFFMWCCLNPRAEVANKLYDFLERNSYRITKQGFFAALRNVVTVGGENTDLVQFISNAYNKIKAVWKKNPENYNVYNNGEYTLVKKGSTISETNLVGNLKDLYTNLPDMKENRFTDAHTHTFDIRVGKVVTMPPEKCSWSTVDCAEAGLHFTADEIHYVGCGDTSVLVLINPMKVVGIGEHKGRCYEYLPIMTVPAAEATTLLHDLEFDTLQLDEEYVIHQLEGLSEKVKEGFTAETSKYTFNLPSISTMEINDIISRLGEMKAKISTRVSIIE